MLVDGTALPEQEPGAERSGGGLVQTTHFGDDERGRGGETEVVEEKNCRLKAVARCLVYYARGRQVSGLVRQSRCWREWATWKDGTHGEPVLKQQIIEGCGGVDGVPVQPVDGR